VLRYGGDVLQNVLSTISDAFTRAKGSGELQRAFGAAIKDMVLTPTEIAELRAIVTSHKLTADEVQTIGEGVLREAITLSKADGQFSDAELKTLQDIATLTQVPQQTLAGMVAQLGVQRKMYELSQGRIAPIPNPGIQLRAGENPYWSTPVRLYEERVVRRETVGRSSGMTFRIMRGVSYRVGGSRGHSVPVTASVEVARGNLTITDQRLVFMGDRQTVIVALDDVVGVDPYTNAITVHAEKRKQPVQFFYQNTEEAEFVAQVIAYVLR
jgi:hypothetical protein